LIECNKGIGERWKDLYMMSSSIKCCGYANVSSVHRYIVLVTLHVSAYQLLQLCQYILQKFHIHTNIIIYLAIILYLICKHISYYMKFLFVIFLLQYYAKNLSLLLLWKKT